MRIGRAELIERGSEVQIRAPITWEGRTEYLWYAVERRYAEHLSPETLDAFVVALLLPAMAAKEDIHIEGPVSERLYWNLTHSYMRIMSSMNPVLRSVHLLPSELNSGRRVSQPTGVGTGFSAGIDSFSVLADHLFDEVPSGYKLTHLVFNNVGSHWSRKMFLDRYERLRSCAEQLQLPFIRIDSNLDLFYTINFQRSHSPRNISAALILQKLFGRFLYASAFRYEDCFVGRAPSAAYADPAAIHLLSTETMESLSVGSQYSRVEKTMRVAELELSHRYLDVCIDSQPPGNCGVCWKCARTLLTLELLGKATLYKDVFPLDRYSAKRRYCQARMLSKKDLLAQEILRLARERDYRFPWDVTTLAVVRRASVFLNDLLPWRLWCRVNQQAISAFGRSRR